jgi:membrane protease subunit HflC
VRDVVSSHSLIEVIRSTNRSMQLDLTESPEDVEELDIGNVQRGRDQLCAQILEEAAPLMESVGVRLLDVRIKRLRYVESVLQEVYSRMVSERERIAARYLSEGKGERAKIQGDLERDLKRIESEAFRDAERIRGEADATAAGIYAEAYEQDPEFYGFVKTLDTYREALGSDVTVLLSSQSELFRFLKGELLPE